jgi:hypothetical protein
MSLKKWVPTPDFEKFLALSKLKTLTTVQTFAFNAVFAVHPSSMAHVALIGHDC